MHETDLVEERYQRRKEASLSGRYSYLNASVYMSQQEKERALIRWLHEIGWSDLSDKRVLEVGCGTGGNLLQLLRFGFKAENMLGNELLADRCEEARLNLPQGTQLLPGDAAKLDLARESFDVVLQSTVFTSLLDLDFQEQLARKIWSLVKPGGGVLWYDFTFDNPNNPDVRGVKVRRIKELFPEGRLVAKRITLAPPVSRRVCRVSPWLYPFFNMFPFLRTHVLCWIQK